MHCICNPWEGVPSRYRRDERRRRGRRWVYREPIVDPPRPRDHLPWPGTYRPAVGFSTVVKPSSPLVAAVSGLGDDEAELNSARGGATATGVGEGAAAGASGALACWLRGTRLSRFRSPPKAGEDDGAGEPVGVGRFQAPSVEAGGRDPPAFRRARASSSRCCCKRIFSRSAARCRSRSSRAAALAFSSDSRWRASISART